MLLGVGLLVASRAGTTRDLASRAQSARGFVLAGMLMALLVEFAVAPRIVARVNLPLWHGLGSAMWLVQWMCAALAFWRLVRRDAPVQV